MDCLEIEGGRKLCGQVRIQGSKNAVLPILSAALLNPELQYWHDCPEIADVTAMGELLKGFGCQLKWEGNSLWIRAGIVKAGTGAAPGAESMRASVLRWEAFWPEPGKLICPIPAAVSSENGRWICIFMALRQLGRGDTGGRAGTESPV